MCGQVLCGQVLYRWTPVQVDSCTGGLLYRWTPVQMDSCTDGLLYRWTPVQMLHVLYMLCVLCFKTVSHSSVHSFQPLQVVAFFNGKIDQLEQKPLSSAEVMDVVSQASKTWSKTRLRVSHSSPYTAPSIQQPRLCPSHLSTAATSIPQPPGYSSHLSTAATSIPQPPGYSSYLYAAAISGFQGGWLL